MDDSDISTQSSVDILDDYISENLHTVPHAKPQTPLIPPSSITSSLSGLLSTPNLGGTSKNILNLADESFGVTTTAKKRAESSELSNHPLDPPFEQPGSLDAYLISSSLPNSPTHSLTPPSSPLSENSFEQINHSKLTRQSATNTSILTSAKKHALRLKYPEQLYADPTILPTTLSPPRPSGTERYRNEALSKLSSTVAPIVRGALIPNSTSSHDPDVILRRLQDHHQMRLADLSKTKMLLESNDDSLDDELNLSLDESFGNISMEDETFMTLSGSEDVINAVSAHAANMTKNLGVGKVNSTIQEVLRTKGRGGKMGSNTFLRGHQNAALRREDESESDDDDMKFRVPHIPLHRKTEVEEAKQEEYAKQAEEEMEQEEEETKQQGKEEKEEEEEEKEEEAKQDKDIKQEDEEEVEDTKEEVPLEEDEREEKSDGDSPKTPFPKQTPSKLLSQFNKSNNLTMDSPQSLFKTPADIPSDSQQPPDTLQTIASSLQHLVSKFSEIGQQQERFYRQQSQQVNFSTTSLSALDISLAKPAPGQFEDIDDDEGDEGDDRNNTGSTLDRKKGARPASLSNVNVSAIPKDDDSSVRSSSTSNASSSAGDPERPKPSNLFGVRGFSSPPLRKNVKRGSPNEKNANKASARKPAAKVVANNLENLGVAEEESRIQATITSTDRNLPEYEKVMYIHNRNEALKNMNRNKNSSTTQTQYDANFDESTTMENGTQMSPERPTSPYHKPKYVTSSTSTTPYFSPLKLHASKTFLKFFIKSNVLPWFHLWRVNALPPLPLSTVAPPRNKETAKLEEVGETCIFALRSRIGTDGSVTDGILEKKKEEATMIKPVPPLTVEDILPRTPSPLKEDSSYEKARSKSSKIDFSKLGIHMPTCPSPTKSTVSQPVPLRPSIVVDDNASAITTNSLMPVEYLDTIKSLKARYGSTAPMSMVTMSGPSQTAVAPVVTFGTGGAGETGDDKPISSKVFGTPLYQRVSDMTVERVWNSDPAVSYEMLGAREALRLSTVGRVVEDKGRREAVGRDVKDSIKWLSTPPKKIHASSSPSSGRGEDRPTSRTGKTPGSSSPRKLTFRRSPLRNISPNKTSTYTLPSSSSEVEECGNSLDILRSLRSKIASVSEELVDRDRYRKSAVKEVGRMKRFMEEARAGRMNVRLYSGGGKDWEGGKKDILAADDNFARKLVRGIMNTGHGGFKPPAPPRSPEYDLSFMKGKGRGGGGEDGGGDDVSTITHITRD